MARVYLILGSNLGNRLWYIEEAKIRLLQSTVIIQQSLIYETEPWGYNDSNYFLNQVIIIETDLSPSELLENIKYIETSLGRTNTVIRYSSRIIDIDILFYDMLIINTPELIIPHPEIANRRFVLEPLKEINPLFVHPELLKNIAELHDTCKDNCKVEVYRDI